MSIFETCEGPFAHVDIINGPCPRCGQWRFFRRYDETDDEFRARVDATLEAAEKADKENR